MAENKKGFILYCDLIHTVEQLPNDKAGELFKHILRYVNDLNPVTDDLLTKITFEPIKQQLKRDLSKWTEKSIKRSEAGRLGGLKSGEVRKQNEANEAIASKLKQNEQVTDTVTVKGKVKVKEEEEEIKQTILTFDEFWDLYGKKVGKIKAQDLFEKTTEAERKLIKEFIPKYKISKPDLQYRKDPERFLKNRAWEDEIISTEPEDKTGMFFANGQWHKKTPMQKYQ